MPDRDPAQPGHLSPGTPSSPGSPESTALRDRWWWSPTLSIVVGAVVIGYQWEVLTGPDPLWASWVVAALGLAVAVWGAVRLLRAYRSR